jgi:hypothetical protein
MARAPCTGVTEKQMKIKSNVRAGKKSSQINNTVVTYVPPVSRCVGH